MSKLPLIFARIRELIGKLSRRDRILIAVASVVVLAAGVGFWSYPSNLPEFSPITLSKSGLLASIKTKWVDGGSRYILRIEPIPGTEARFDGAIRSAPDWFINFDVYLYDSDGFQVCKGSPFSSPLSREVGDDGKYSGLYTEGVFICSRSRLKQAVRWDVEYRFPPLEADKHPAS